MPFTLEQVNKIGSGNDSEDKLRGISLDQINNLSDTDRPSGQEKLKGVSLDQINSLADPSQPRLPQKNLIDDFVQSFAETGENLKIGGISLAASALENIKRRGMQAVGGGVPAFEETIRPLFEPVVPAEREGGLITTEEDIEISPGVVIPAGTELLRRDRIDPAARAPQGAGTGAEALGVVTRIPDIAAKILRGKQKRLQAEQEPVTFSSAPLTRTARAVVQGGIPSVAVAIGVSIVTGNPAIGLAILGETEGGAAFQQQLEAGASVGKASILGELSEAAEIGGEMLVFPKLFGAIVDGIPFNKAVRLIGENATQEAATGFVQRFLEVFGTETTEGTSFKEAAKLAFDEGVKAVPESALVGGITAGVVDVTAGGLSLLEAASDATQTAFETLRRQTPTDEAGTRTITAETEAQAQQIEKELADIAELRQADIEIIRKGKEITVRELTPDQIEQITAEIDETTQAKQIETQVPGVEVEVQPPGEIQTAAEISAEAAKGEDITVKSPIIKPPALKATTTTAKLGTGESETTEKIADFGNGLVRFKNQVFHKESQLKIAVYDNAKEAREAISRLAETGIDFKQDRDTVIEDLKKWAKGLNKGVTKALNEIAEAGEDVGVFNKSVLNKIAAEKGPRARDRIKKAFEVVESRLKAFTSTVPEFTVNPVFVVEEDQGVKFLVFRDNFRFRFFPEHFGLSQANLKNGQRIRFDLDTFGIRQASRARLKREAVFSKPAEAEQKIEQAIGRPTEPTKLKGVTLGDIERLEQVTVGITEKPSLTRQLERGPIAKGEAVAKSDIIQQLSRSFDVPIRSFSTHRSTFAGFFKIREKGIRQRDVRDIRVATHEVGHLVDRNILGRVSQRPPAGTSAELLKLGKELYGEKVPPGGFKSEGFAEFVSKFMMGEDTQAQAPNFHKWFTETLLPGNPELAKKINEIKDQIERFNQQGAVARVDAFIARKADKGTIGERVERFTQRLQTELVDRFTPLRRGIDKAGIDRSKLRPTDDPFLLATVFSDKSGAKTRQFALQYTTNLAGVRTGDSLQDILKPVAKNFRGFENFVVAARARLLISKDKQAGISKEDADFVFDQFKDEPGFRKALKGVTEWNHRGLDFMVESGALSKQVADKIKKNNPVYVPFFREFKPGEKRKISGGVGKGLTQKGTVIKRLKGSGREILPPFESMLLQMEKAISVSQKSAIAKALAGLEKNFGGLSGLIEKVPAPIEATTVRAGQIVDQLAEAGINVKDVKPEQLDNLITVFTPGKRFVGTDNIVTLIIDGEPQFFEVAPEIYTVLEGVDQYHLPWIVDVIFGKATRLGRLGATGLNPAFGLIRNAARDISSFTVLSRHANLGPLSAMIGIGKALKTKASSALSKFGIGGEFVSENVFIPDKDAQLFSALGGEMASQLIRDRRGRKHLTHEVLASSGKKYVFNTFLHPVDALRSLFSISESGTRIGEFSAALKEGEKRWGKNSADASFFALEAGQDVTVNFTRAGNVARVMNQAIMFFNAGIQGPNKIFRTFKARPTVTTLKAMATLMVPALVLWWRNKDEDWYQSLSSYEKTNYTHIKVPGKDVVIRYPVPFELGYAFQSVPVAFMDQVWQDDPKIAKEIIEHAIQGANPFDWPAAVGPIIDVKANEDFAGRKIVPRSVLGKLPEDQFKTDTTGLMRLIGKTIGASPAQIEHLVNSYSGGLYARLSSFIDTESRDGQLSDIPVIGTLFVRDPFAPKIQITRFYNAAENLNRKFASGKLERKALRRRKVYNTAIRALSPLWKELRTAETVRDRAAVYKKIGQLIETANKIAAQEVK